MSEEVKAPRPPKRAPKKKVCTFCVEHAETIDYKDAAKLRRFTTEKGKILPQDPPPQDERRLRQASETAGDCYQAGESYGFAPLQSRLNRTIWRTTLSAPLFRLVTYDVVRASPKTGRFRVLHPNGAV